MAFAIPEQPASHFLNPGRRAWDVLVFYDMPGIDFSTQLPGLIPPANLKSGFNELLSAGKGMVLSITPSPAGPLASTGGYRRPLFLRPCRVPRQGGAGLRISTRHHSHYQRRGYGTPNYCRCHTRFSPTDELYLYEVFEEDVRFEQ